MTPIFKVLSVLLTSDAEFSLFPEQEERAHTIIATEKEQVRILYKLFHF